MEAINKRISDYFTIRINKFLKRSLDSIEYQTKEFNIDNDFFSNKDNKGFYAIRKNILDEGNDMIRLFEIVMSELEIVPKKSMVKING